MVLKKHELLEVIKNELYTPVVGDILDQMGLYHQFLPQAVRPLKDDMKLAGYAMTVLMIDVFGQQKKPFGYLTEALDDLQEDEIYMAAGGTMRCAYWGELLTATAKKRGAAGAVVKDGTGIRLKCWNRTGLYFPGDAMPRILLCVPRWWITAAGLREKE